MSASKRVDYHKSDKEAPLFCKVKAERRICFPVLVSTFFGSFLPMKSAPSAKLMRTPIQSCITKRCPLLKSHIKVRALSYMLCHCALQKCLKVPG